MDKRTEKARPVAHAFVAPVRVQRERVAELIESLGNSGSPGPRRYVGRSSSEREKVPPTLRGESPRAQQVMLPRQRLKSAVSAVARLQTMRWSLRLAVTVTLLCSLVVGLRLPGLFTPPIDSPTGVEATYALSARAMTGQLAGTLDPAHLYPPPSPWYGPAAANPSTSLPIYDLLAGYAGKVLSEGDWAGRALSILFDLLAALALFALVRRVAGARAAVYALLLFAAAPLSVVLGRAYSPDSLLILSQVASLLTLVTWRLSVSETRQQGATTAFALAVLVGVIAALLDPGIVFLVLPTAYIFMAPRKSSLTDFKPAVPLARQPRAPVVDWRSAWAQTAFRGKFLGYAGALLGAAALWWLLGLSANPGLSLSAGDGGGGLAARLAPLLSPGTLVQLVGGLVEKVLTIGGLLLLGAGLLQGARQPLRLLFHAWLIGAMVHVLADSSRLGRHDDVLLPLLLPMCALVGIGASWAGSLPTRVWLAITENRTERDAEYEVSPHTSWLLDLPEERLASPHVSRPQAQLALGKSVAQRMARTGNRARRAALMAVGHLIVLVGFAVVFASGWSTTSARLHANAETIALQEIGRAVSAVTPSGARLIIAGPHAPELFYAANRTGWAIPADGFSLSRVEALQREGAAFLLSADQQWLGNQPDYIGLLTNYSVVKLANDYILFDLNAKPSASDRLYFLESGHTLGGDFRRFWEQNGGVQKLGYPISEEMESPNPIDGQTRKVQYFERAVLELHPEYAGSPDAVQLASVGLWVTKGRDFQRVAPFVSTQDRVYFPQTGHSLKQAFLRYWQTQGGLAVFGYPVSEELPEIGDDGKVYTVQYFERARFEWHPTGAGTSTEVQLGLIGKQAYELTK